MACIVAVVACLIFSGSRGAIISTAMATALLVGLVAHQTRMSLLYAAVQIAGLILLAGVIFTIADVAIPKRIGDLTHYDEIVQKYEESGRPEHMHEAFKSFLASPLFGGGSQAERLHVSGQIRGHHNMYLALLAVSGVWGFLTYVLFLVLLAYLLLRALQNRHGDAESIIAATRLSMLAMILVHGYVISIEYAVHTWIVYALAADAGMRLYSQGDHHGLLDAECRGA
jgi:O-antigen ligase